MNCQNCKNPADKQCACHGVFYCSKDCQTADFPEHKRVCKAVTRMKEAKKQVKKEAKKEVKKEINKIKSFKSAIHNNDKMQDVVSTFENKNFTVTVLCDGHGHCDVRAIYPKTSADSFIRLVQSGRTDYPNWAKEIDVSCAEAVKSAYSLIEDSEGVLYKYNGDIFHGGTTLSAIIIDRLHGEIIWINAGDSDICFFSESGEVETLSSDHSPSAIESWKQLNELSQKGVNVGTLRWNSSSRKKICSPTTKLNACPLIFDDKGTPIDYAIDFAKAVHQTTEEYHDAFSLCQTHPTSDNKHKLKVCLENYQKAVHILNSHPNLSINKLLIVSTVSGDCGCYLTGPIDCKTGLDTELAMVRAIGDRHAMLHGATCEFSIGRRPLSAFTNGCFFVASDGVWDSFRVENLSKFVMSKKNNEFVGEKDILTYVVESALTKFGKKHDDISFAFARKF